ncbi:MAG: DUF1800 domain-containing protein [Herbaspirillum sp.]|jgi:uncharacterized protein (DUF1800 family)|nr:DUF1800 domain-containing protein [Herbaspirillum sp.]MCP3656448.1 DUF1800 domain-containing protein [Herbaspirillum sp.]MCP3948465.1 DUF1800 domain-containing protein [Herbaspirillum sp.]MCP4031614.1 DUF1800 domain-containing protein [Herbaspirillum sp.]MCP4558012.1 DUF1800 domain-containing protein [Herbaspirillum sp.]
MQAPFKQLFPSRSAWLMLALVACTLGQAQAAGPTSASAPLSEQERALHVLNRLAYGPRPGDLEQVERMGVKRYIDQQLHPERIPLPDDLQARLAALPGLQMTPAQLFVDYGPPSFDRSASKEEQQAARQRAPRELTPQFHMARLLQASESPRQLEEVMTEFWANHFNVFEGKEWVRYWVGDYEKNAIRPYALGNFRDLLGAVAHHPAMLYYLDNWLSSGAGTPGARGRFKGLNENYARELMELHTLGVNGGYQQADVITLARILSGWTIDVDAMKAGASPFRFAAQRHDNGPKIFLGKPLQASGYQEGEAALDILANHPSTARFISTQLVEYFVADQPDPALVNKLAQKFLASHGDIRAVLQTLFDSPQFWARSNYQTQFKTPYQFVVSALRAGDIPVRNAKPVNGELGQFGMPLYGWLTPEGYKYSQAAWLNPGALLRRINLAGNLASGKSPIARVEGAPAPSNTEAPPLDAAALLRTLGPAITPATAAQINAAPENQRAGLILGSPDFMKR